MRSQDGHGDGGERSRGGASGLQRTRWGLAESRTGTLVLSRHVPERQLCVRRLRFRMDKLATFLPDGIDRGYSRTDLDYVHLGNVLLGDRLRTVIAYMVPSSDAKIRGVL